MSSPAGRLHVCSAPRIYHQYISTQPKKFRRMFELQSKDLRLERLVPAKVNDKAVADGRRSHRGSILCLMSITHYGSCEGSTMAAMAESGERVM